MRAINLRLIIGLTSWVGFQFYFPTDPNREIILNLLFAILVVMPLGIDLSRHPEEKHSNMYAAAKYLQPFAGLVTAASFFMSKGVLAGTLAIVWLPLTGLLAVDAIMRLRDRGFWPIEEAAIDIGAVFLPIGAFWLWASRMGLGPFGFEEPFVLLKAVHFHYAGFAGPLLAGLAGRHFKLAMDRLPMGYGLAIVLTLAGPALVATGFLFSTTVEALSAALLAAGYFWISLILLVNLRKSVPAWLPGFLLFGSGISVMLTMLFALAYAVGNASRIYFIPVSQMVSIHGWLNAVGFVFLGLLGWAFLGNGEMGSKTE